MFSHITKDIKECTSISFIISSYCNKNNIVTKECKTNISYCSN